MFKEENNHDLKIKRKAIKKTILDLKNIISGIRKKGRKLTKEELREIEEYINYIYEKNIEKFLEECKE